ncbi:MAG: hypothetical protein EXX96DRAFT_587126 [Benjaminiella poitrasii]|nr:MAG: hypothetical protein EXX96DRAFT_587126 [Benjaminiella poitrasii]
MQLNTPHHVQSKAILRKCKANILLNQSNSTTSISLLTHCQLCLQPFQKPITLSCGFTLCLSCIPTTTTTSLFKCPSFSCLRTHDSSRYYQTNILLESLLTATAKPHQKEIEKKDNVNHLLVCPICLGLLEKPVTTECGHTFCQSCLVHILSLFEPNSPTCPICRHSLNRLIKLDQVITAWINQTNNNSHTLPSSSSYNILPLIQISDTVIFPTQQCLFHVNDNDNHRHLMQQGGYAICVFSRHHKQQLYYYSYGLVVQVEHVDDWPDRRHLVIQGLGLFPFRINQLAIDHEDESYYVGDMILLDHLATTTTSTITTNYNIDNNEDEVMLTSTNLPSSSLTTTTANMMTQRKRDRPSSMRLGTTMNTMTRPSILQQQPTIGPCSRKSWAITMYEQRLNRSRYILLRPQRQQQQQTLKLQQSQPTEIYIDNVNDDDVMRLFYEELHPSIIEYLSNEQLMQYNKYVKQTVVHLNKLVWWLATILPLTEGEKIQLLSTTLLRKRVAYVICWIKK